LIARAVRWSPNRVRHEVPKIGAGWPNRILFPFSLLAINACRCSSGRDVWISALFLSFGSVRVLFVDFFSNRSFAFPISGSLIRKFLVSVVQRVEGKCNFLGVIS
jgi:hypothetical protein